MTKAETYSTRAYFVAWGERCDPVAISTNTLLQPTKTWRIGDVRNERTQKCHDDSGWRIDSDGAGNLDPEAHVRLLADRLWHARDYLAALGATCALQFTVVIRARETAPPIHFCRELLHRVSSLNASIDVDLYCR